MHALYSTVQHSLQLPMLVHHYRSAAQLNSCALQMWHAGRNAWYQKHDNGAAATCVRVEQVQLAAHPGTCAVHTQQLVLLSTQQQSTAHVTHLAWQAQRACMIKLP